MTSTTSATTPIQFKLPVLTIPEDVTPSEYGYPEFTIETPEGLIIVIAYHCWACAYCKGSIAALVSAGFMLSE